MTFACPDIASKPVRGAALAAAIWAFGMVLVLWPATAKAGGLAGRCVEIGQLGMAGAHGFFAGQATPAVSPAEGASIEAIPVLSTPCGQQDDPGGDADPSSNLCFEDAAGQISTLPRLIASWRGGNEAAAVVESILEALGPEEGEAPAGEFSPEVLRLVTSLDALRDTAPGPGSGGDALSCSTEDPEQCHALPPLRMLPEVVATAAIRPAAYDFEQVLSLPLPRLSPWAALNIGPRAGHDRLPDKPPRA